MRETGAKARCGPLRSRVLTMALFLLAGAVVNAVVAWGCAVALNPVAGRNEFGVSASTAPCWFYQVFSRPGATQVHSSRIASDPAKFMADLAWGFSRYSLDQSEWHRSVRAPSWSRASSAAGWPVVSMHSTARVRHDELADTAVQEDIRFGIALGTVRAKPVVLPLGPLWPGFLVDTLFYAVGLWFLIRGPFALRRFLRIRGGLCPRCAYPMGASDACSECGRELPRGGGIVRHPRERLEPQ